MSCSNGMISVEKLLSKTGGRTYRGAVGKKQ